MTNIHELVRILQEAKAKCQADRAAKIKVKLRRRKYAVFIDLEKAFDKVNRQILINKMFAKRIEAPYLDAVRLNLINSKAHIQGEVIDQRIGV